MNYIIYISIYVIVGILLLMLPFVSKEIYMSIYIVVSVLIFMLLFMCDKIFNFLFEKVFNNITDYNDPNYTGGIEYIFNPYRHLKCQKT